MVQITSFVTILRKGYLQTTIKYGCSSVYIFLLIYCKPSMKFINLCHFFHQSWSCSFRLHRYLAQKQNKVFVDGGRGGPKTYFKRHSTWLQQTNCSSQLALTWSWYTRFKVMGIYGYRLELPLKSCVKLNSKQKRGPLLKWNIGVICTEANRVLIILAPPHAEAAAIKSIGN